MNQQIRILAVDDDRTAGIIYQAIGRRFGFETVIVSDAESALAEIDKAEFDVILMDWRLPGIDGMECTRIIRARKAQHARHTPIIAVTAYAMYGDRNECLAAGADDYISKPFNLHVLETTIREWSRRKSQIRQQATG